MNSTTGEGCPFFVYGTLRQGFRNFIWVAKYVTRVAPATLQGAEMYLVGPKGDFPAIVPGEGVVKGELLFIHPHKYKDAVKILDYVESEGFLYKRELVEVETGDGKKEAWAYFWINEGFLLHHKIQGNDWALFKGGRA